MSMSHHSQFSTGVSYVPSLHYLFIYLFIYFHLSTLKVFRHLPQLYWTPRRVCSSPGRVEAP